MIYHNPSRYKNGDFILYIDNSFIQNLQYDNPYH